MNRLNQNLVGKVHPYFLRKINLLKAQSALITGLVVIFAITQCSVIEEDAMLLTDSEINDLTEVTITKGIAGNQLDASVGDFGFSTTNGEGDDDSGDRVSAK